MLAASIDNPLFGTGVNSYAVDKIPYLESGLVQNSVSGDISVHNQFFNALVEFPLLGLISVVSIYGVFIMYYRQYAQESKGLAIAGLFLAVGFIDFGLVESMWGINNAGVFFTV